MLGAAGKCIAAFKGANLGPVVPVFTSETTRDTPTTTSLLDMTTDQSTLVTVGGVNGPSSTTICRYSTNDGITWANATITAGKPLKNVEFADGIFVAAGDFNGFGGTQDAHVFTSTDGQTWTSRLNTGTIGDRVRDLKYSVLHDQWILALDRGDTPALYTSPDGITWTARTLPNPNSPNDYVMSIVESDSQLFIVGTGYNAGFTHIRMYHWTTTNGTTWAAATNGGLVQTDDLYDIIYVPNEDVFCVLDENRDLAYYGNTAGLPVTKTVFDTTATVVGTEWDMNLNLAGGVFVGYWSTWGIATSDGKTSYNRRQVAGGSGSVAKIIQHKLQYFGCGFNNTNGVVYEFEE